MNIKSLFLEALILTGLFTSCEKNQTDPEISLVFGEAYGYCIGDCAHFFQISGERLYKDNIERYNGDFPTFEATPLSDADYELANSLLTNFPRELLEMPNQTLGCPDCADQGGIHLYYTVGGQQYFWHIDTFVDNQLVEIRQYINQVRGVVIDLGK